MKDNLYGLLGISLVIGMIIAYIYGVASAFDDGNTFLAVASLIIPPIGLIYGLIAFIF